MRTITLMLCLLSSGAMAQEQTYDYQGNAMMGNAVETFTASLTFIGGPVTSPNTDLNWTLNITGNALNTSYSCSGCSIGITGGETQPTIITVNAKNGVLQSAD